MGDVVTLLGTGVIRKLLLDAVQFTASSLLRINEMAFFNFEGGGGDVVTKERNSISVRLRLCKTCRTLMHVPKNNLRETFLKKSALKMLGSF